MLKKIYLFTFVCIFSLNVYAIDSEETFLKASDSYNNKKYAQALDLYKSIDKKGPVIFYNIGNCEFELGKYFDALVFYSRAKKNASLDLLNAINHNISVASYKLGVPGQEASKIETFWQKLEDYVNLFSMFKLQVLFLILWFLFFIIYIFLKKLRAFFITINIIFIIIFGFFVFVKYGLEKYQFALVKSKTAVYLGPSENYHKISDISVVQRVQIRACESVKIKKEYRDWYKIKYNGGVG